VIYRFYFQLIARLYCIINIPNIYSVNTCTFNSEMHAVYTENIEQQQVNIFQFEIAD